MSPFQGPIESEAYCITPALHDVKGVISLIVRLIPEGESDQDSCGWECEVEHDWESGPTSSAKADTEHNGA